MRRLALPLLVLLLLAAAPAVASADTLIAPDAAAKTVTALNGTVVWVSGEFGAQRLMQSSAAGSGPLAGAPQASSYRSIDLGLDRDGELVLTYVRCDTPHRCKSLRDDLHGGRASHRGLEIRNCTLGGAVSLWRSRAAYGLFCRKGRFEDTKRSGLYVKADGAAPRRLPLPQDAARFGVTGISSVDLRGTQVAAIASDVYEYAFSQTVGGKGLRSVFAASSEGETDGHAGGLALQSAGTFWTLATTQHLDDPLESAILRQAGGCLRVERLLSPPLTFEFRAIDLAVDGSRLLLVVPGMGIVEHPFVPAATPSC